MKSKIVPIQRKTQNVKTSNGKNNNGKNRNGKTRKTGPTKPTMKPIPRQRKFISQLS
jgi:hypothetical protein